jgi:hypothetical protein
MTKYQYQQYAKNVSNFFEREKIVNLSATESEAFFSSASCDCCGNQLAGDRLLANGFNPEADEVQEYEVCLDCIYFAEYGQLDDQTMLDIAEPTYDKFDIVEAYYWWLVDHHSGQNSKEYERVCRLEKIYQPGFYMAEPSSENAKAIYSEICIRENCQHD